MVDNNEYNYIIAGNKVICTSTYAGKAVRGVAKCNPEDEFNEEYGRNLARLRCVEQIAMKQISTAKKRFEYYAELLKGVNDEVVRCQKQLEQASKEYSDVRQEIDNL